MWDTHHAFKLINPPWRALSQVRTPSPDPPPGQHTLGQLAGTLGDIGADPEVAPSTVFPRLFGPTKAWPTQCILILKLPARGWAPYRACRRDLGCTSKFCSSSTGVQISVGDCPSFPWLRGQGGWWLQCPKTATLPSSPAWGLFPLAKILMRTRKIGRKMEKAVVGIPGRASSRGTCHPWVHPLHLWARVWSRGGGSQLPRVRWDTPLRAYSPRLEEKLLFHPWLDPPAPSPRVAESLG